MIIVISAPFSGILGKESAPFEDGQTVEEYVRDYFKDIPVMAEIARCESTFRHVTKEGTIVRGEVNPDDIGVMQINEFYHTTTADTLGHDLYTLEGNLEYARSLHERKGTSPWSASKACWDSGGHIVKK